jgi:predicted HicB family RNase H-like nuclease
MTYKGYEADVQFDEEARLFHGEIVNIPRDVITFQGSSVNDLVQAFHDSVDDYLEMCASRGDAPEEPLSNDISIPITPEVRRRLMLDAKHHGKTVEEYLNDTRRLPLTR